MVVNDRFNNCKVLDGYTHTYRHEDWYLVGPASSVPEKQTSSSKRSRSIDDLLEVCFGDSFENRIVLTRKEFDEFAWARAYHSSSDDAATVAAVSAIFTAFISYVSIARNVPFGFAILVPYYAAVTPRLVGFFKQRKAKKIFNKKYKHRIEKLEKPI